MAADAPEPPFLWQDMQFSPALWLLPVGVAQVTVLVGVLLKAALVVAAELTAVLFALEDLLLVLDVTAVFELVDDTCAALAAELAAMSTLL
jgi:hypothetical protein